jgi:hypothetical protein
VAVGRRDFLCAQGAGEGDFVETFSRVRGFFLHYNDEKVDPTGDRRLGVLLSS